MDDNNEMIMSPDEKLRAEMMEQVKENCKILGVPFSDEYLTNARKRAGLTMRVKNLIKRMNLLRSLSLRKRSLSSLSRSLSLKAINML